MPKYVEHTCAAHKQTVVLPLFAKLMRVDVAIRMWVSCAVDVPSEYDSPSGYYNGN